MTNLFDRKTAAFYLGMLLLLVLDAILVVWTFNPLSNLGTQVYASEKRPVVSDTAKPSAFEPGRR